MEHDHVQNRPFQRQIPDAPSGCAHQVLHCAVFQERRLEGALLAAALVEIGGARGAGPHLRDVAVRAHIDQRRLGTHDPPVRIVDQGVSGNVAADRPVVGLTVLLREIEDLRKRAPVEIVLQLGGPVLRAGRRVWSSPNPRGNKPSIPV